MSRRETYDIITREEVISAQKSWGDAIVSIVEAYTNKGD